FTRRLDQFKATELPGTEGAVAPFFSSDGQWIGFSVAPNKLNKISVEGGAVVPLGNVPLVLGASWGKDGAVVGGRAGYSGGLVRIAAGGGQSEPLIEVVTGEYGHGSPQVLPGGKAILFVVYRPITPADFGGNVEVLTLADRRTKLLVPGATSPRYLPSGHLI